MPNTDNNNLYSIFAKAFHEVVAPILENIENRIKKIEENMTTVATKEDIDRIEIKLTKMGDRLDRHDHKLDNHEKRISTIESVTSS